MKTQNSDEDMKQLKCSYVVGRHEKLYNHLEMLFSVFFLNLNTHLTASNSTPMNLPNKNKNKNICPQKIL